jgi:hypothetical protein
VPRSKQKIFTNQGHDGGGPPIALEQSAPRVNCTLRVEITLVRVEFTLLCVVLADLFLLSWGGGIITNQLSSPPMDPRLQQWHELNLHLVWLSVSEFKP